MSEKIMFRFKANSSDPADKSGVATLTFANQSCSVALMSFTHAQQLEHFMAHVAKVSSWRGRQAAAKVLKGAAQSLEDQP